LVLPEKMKRKALKVALSAKAESKEIVAVDGLSKIKKTKDIQGFLKKLMKLPRANAQGIFSPRFVGSGIPPKRKTLRSDSQADTLGVSRRGIKYSPEIKKFTFVLGEANLGVRKALKNIQNVNILSYKDLNAYTVFYGGMIILDKEIFKKK
jgi:ribosomal protein L4